MFGGLGARLGIDPLLLRIAAVAAAVLVRDVAPLATPGLYALAWIVLPPAGGRSLLRSLNRAAAWQEAAGAVLIAATGALLVAVPALWLAGALAGGAWLLLARADAAAHQSSAGTEPTTGSAPGPGSAAHDRTPAAPDPTRRADDRRADEAHGVAEDGVADADRAAEDPVTASATVASSDDPDHPDGPSAQVAARWGRSRRGATSPLPALRLPRVALPPRRRRARREPALWPLTLVLLLAFVVVCSALDNLLEPGLDPAVFVNGALLIIGGVLLVSAWRGRAGWTALLALPLLPLWVAFSAADIGRFPGTGSVSVEVSSPPGTAPVVVEHGYGSLDVEVHASALRPDVPVRIRTSQTAGSTTVVVPERAEVVLVSRAGLGMVKVNGADGPWSNDEALRVSSQSRRHLRPVEVTCVTESVTPDDLTRWYDQWRIEQQLDHEDHDLGFGAPDLDEHGLDAQGLQRYDFERNAEPPARPMPSGARDPERPDFTDPAVTEHADVAWFLGDRDMSDLAPVGTGEDMRWEQHRDLYGRTCVPGAPFETLGVVEIDATIGLGAIDVVRRFW